MLNRFCKRVFDIFASFFGLVILSPIFIIVAIIIKSTSKGGIFFHQTRVGRNGKNFIILKFRSMVTNAEAKGMQITVNDDNRITKIGKFIRKAKIDELPQLINVFKGDMSLVGPRPEVPKYVALYNDEQRAVLSVRPGITDIASIEFSNENEMLSSAENPEEKYINEIMPAKLALNLAYISKMNLFTDIKLIFKTILKVLK